MLRGCEIKKMKKQLLIILGVLLVGVLFAGFVGANVCVDVWNYGTDNDWRNCNLGTLENIGDVQSGKSCCGQIGEKINIQTIKDSSGSAISSTDIWLTQLCYNAASKECCEAGDKSIECDKGIKCARTYLIDDADTNIYESAKCCKPGERVCKSQDSYGKVTEICWPKEKLCGLKKECFKIDSSLNQYGDFLLESGCFKKKHCNEKELYDCLCEQRIFEVEEEINEEGETVEIGRKIIVAPIPEKCQKGSTYPYGVEIKFSSDLNQATKDEINSGELTCCRGKLIPNTQLCCGDSCGATENNDPTKVCCCDKKASGRTADTCKREGCDFFNDYMVVEYEGEEIDLAKRIEGDKKIYEKEVTIDGKDYTITAEYYYQFIPNVVSRNRSSISVKHSIEDSSFGSPTTREITLRFTHPCGHIKEREATGNRRQGR